MTIDTKRLSEGYEAILEEKNYDINNLSSNFILAMELHRINKRIDDLIDVMERIERELTREP